MKRNIIQINCLFPNIYRSFVNAIFPNANSAYIKHNSFLMFGKCPVSISGVTSSRFYGHENSVLTVKKCISKWQRTFEQSDISDARDSIKNIVAHVLKFKKFTDLTFQHGRILSQGEITEIEKCCMRRLKNEPVQYIIGEWDFRNLTLKMKPPVFIPRPETELLVELVLQTIDKEKASLILEMCCGSGAISLAILQERQTTKVVAIDQSPDAYELTKENAAKLKLKERLDIYQLVLSKEDDLNFLNRKFDIIVSNPPYVFSEDMKCLEKEIVLYEDLNALDGGPDGLDVIIVILRISSKLLRRYGKLFLEVDPRHPKMIHAFLNENADLKLSFVTSHCDMFKKERFVEIQKN